MDKATSKAVVRAIIGAVLVFVWGNAVNIALQQGWFDNVPHWIVLAAFVIPLIGWVVMILTSEAARKHGYLIHKYQTMSLLLFTVCGAALGGVVRLLAIAAYPESKSISDGARP